MGLYEFSIKNNIEHIFNVSITEITEKINNCIYKGIIIENNYLNQLNAVRDYIFSNYLNNNSDFFCMSVKNTLIIFKY